MNITRSILFLPSTDIVQNIFSCQFNIAANYLISFIYVSVLVNMLSDTDATIVPHCLASYLKEKRNRQ